MKKISVVIPAHNEEKYIEKCLLSLENQSIPRKDYEIIVVNDSSTDKTKSVAKKYADRVIDVHARIVGKARDVGFKKASGWIIASTDADTIVPRNWLELISNDLSGGAVAVYGTARVSDGGTLLVTLSGIAYTLFLFLNHYAGRPNLAGFNFAVKKSAVKKVGYFNPALRSCEDIDLAQRLLKVGKVLLNTNLITYTSMRRIRKYGYWKFLAYNMGNYFRYYSTGKGNKYTESH